MSFDKELARSGENESDIELYLSEDIIQGENVPFYLIWRGIDVASIQFRIEGFKSISHLYNVKDPERTIMEGLVLCQDLKTPRYIGGVLTTKLTDNPFRQALLELTLKINNGKLIQLVEKRILHTTSVQITYVPESIQLPSKLAESFVEVELKGSTTVLIGLDTQDRSEIEFVLPKEVLSAIEKFSYAVAEGLKRLKDEFPDYATLIDSIYDVSENVSLRQYFDMIESKFQDVKHDRSFMEAVAMVFVSAILGQGDIKSTLFLPILEYLESTAASKAFFISPFLCAKVPSGGGKLSCWLIVRDLLGNQCEPIAIETILHSDKEALIPLKEMIRVRRL